MLERRRGAVRPLIASLVLAAGLAIPRALAQNPDLQSFD